MKHFKELLDGEFAPFTHCWGFLEAPLAQVAAMVAEWSRVRSDDVRQIPFQGTLRDSLRRLGTIQPYREITLRTQSPWTAFFGGGSQGIEGGNVGFLCEPLRCRGVAVTCVPHTMTRSRFKAGLQGTYGMVQFELYGPHGGPAGMDYVRLISASVETSRWEFETIGEVQPFEKPEYYAAKRIPDRFTPEVLEEYCAALGLRLFDPDFYGPEGFVIEQHGPMVYRPERALCK